MDIQNSKYGVIDHYLNKNDEFFIYLDPPYVPVTSDFNYHSSGFILEDQVKLSCYLTRISKNYKISFMLSNSDTIPIHTMYEEYTIDKVLARRNINSKGDSRKEINEVIVTNYKGDE